MTIFNVKTKTKQELETLDLNLRTEVDALNVLKNEAKKLEKEISDLKYRISGSALQTYVHRFMEENNSQNFKISGWNSQITYIVESRSSGLDEADLANFKTKYGEKTTNKLLQFDIGSVKLNAELFQDPIKKEKIEKAILALTEELGEPLFTAGTYKAIPNALEIVKQLTTNEIEFIEMIGDLKITKFLK